MTDIEWHAAVKAEDGEAWRLVDEQAVGPECRSRKNAEIMAKHSISREELLAMLYEDMIGRGKIDLYRAGGSFQGWLRRYVRGYILAAAGTRQDETVDPTGGETDEDGVPAGVELPFSDAEVSRKEVWNIAHLCLRDLWNEDPERALVLLFKTRFFLSGEEIRDLLEVSSSANVDQIFSRAVRFMREDWTRREKNGWEGTF